MNDRKWQQREWTKIRKQWEKEWERRRVQYEKIYKDRLTAIQAQQQNDTFPVNPITGATSVTTPWNVPGSIFNPPPKLSPTSIYPPVYNSPFVIEDLGMAIEPIVGYKTMAFSINNDGLISLMNYGQNWPYRKPFTAYCGGSSLSMIHDAPLEGCQCGIYAWNKENKGNMANNGYVGGEVYLWGKILICPHGYRAEYAYPKRLQIMKNMGLTASKRMKEVAEQLQENYGVPVEYV